LRILLVSLHVLLATLEERGKFFEQKYDLNLIFELVVQKLMHFAG